MIENTIVLSACDILSGFMDRLVPAKTRKAVPRSSCRETGTARAALLAASLFAGLTLAVSAQAATYSFLYTGSGAPFGGTATDTASGTGSFTISDTANPAVIGDVSGFTFNLAVTYKPQPNAVAGTDNFNYVFADLTAFIADFSGGTVTSLGLGTDLQAAQLNWAEKFMVGSLDAGGAFTSDGAGNIISSGTITITGSDIPEPTSLAITAAGLLALGFRRRRAVQPGRWLNG